MRSIASAASAATAVARPSGRGIRSPTNASITSSTAWVGSKPWLPGERRATRPPGRRRGRARSSAADRAGQRGAATSALAQPRLSQVDGRRSSRGRSGRPNPAARLARRRGAPQRAAVPAARSRPSVLARRQRVDPQRDRDRGGLVRVGGGVGDVPGLAREVGQPRPRRPAGRRSPAPAPPGSAGSPRTPRWTSRRRPRDRACGPGATRPGSAAGPSPRREPRRPRSPASPGCRRRRRAARRSSPARAPPGRTRPAQDDPGPRVARDDRRAAIRAIPRADASNLSQARGRWAGPSRRMGSFLRFSLPVDRAAMPPRLATTRVALGLALAAARARAGRAPGEGAGPPRRPPGPGRRRLRRGGRDRSDLQRLGGARGGGRGREPGAGGAAASRPCATRSPPAAAPDARRLELAAVAAAAAGLDPRSVGGRNTVRAVLAAQRADGSIGDSPGHDRLGHPRAARRRASTRGRGPCGGRAAPSSGSRTRTAAGRSAPSRRGRGPTRPRRRCRRLWAAGARPGGPVGAGARLVAAARASLRRERAEPRRGVPAGRRRDHPGADHRLGDRRPPHDGRGPRAPALEPVGRAARGAARHAARQRRGAQRARARRARRSGPPPRRRWPSPAARCRSGRALGGRSRPARRACSGASPPPGSRRAAR